MHHMRVGSLMVLMLGARLCAQAAPGGLEVTGMLGTQFRTERGSVLDGATIGLGLVLPARGPTRWGIDMSVIQVLVGSGETVANWYAMPSKRARRGHGTAFRVSGI